MILEPSRHRAREAWALLGLLLLAAALRIPGGFTALWLDEVWSLAMVEQLGSARAVLADFRHSNNHALLSLWFLLLGDDREWIWYRIPSLVAGLAAVWLAWQIGRRGSRAEAALAALLITLSYLMIHYSSEGRGYALVVFFSLGTFLATRRFLDGRRASGAALLGGCALGGFLSQPIYLHALAGCGAWLASELWRRSDGWLGWAAELARALCLPVLVSIAVYSLHLRGMVLGGGVDISFAESLTRMLAYAAGGTPFGPLAPFIALAWLWLLAAAGTALWRSRRGEAVCHLVTFAVSPILLLALMQPGPLPTRWFLIGIAFAYLVLAHGFARLWIGRGLARGLAVALVSLFALGNGVQIAIFLRDGRGFPREAVRFLAETSECSRIVVASDHDFRNRILLRFYARYLPEGRELEYVPTDRLSFGWPQWMILHHYGAPVAAQPSLKDPRGHRYELVRSWPASSLSGLQWFVYRRSGATGVEWCP